MRRHHFPFLGVKPPETLREAKEDAAEETVHRRLVKGSSAAGRNSLWQRRDVSVFHWSLQRASYQTVLSKCSCSERLGGWNTLADVPLGTTIMDCNKPHAPSRSQCILVVSADLWIPLPSCSSELLRDRQDSFRHLRHRHRRPDSSSKQSLSLYWGLPTVGNWNYENWRGRRAPLATNPTVTILWLLSNEWWIFRLMAEITDSLRQSNENVPSQYDLIGYLFYS